MKLTKQRIKNIQALLLDGLKELSIDHEFVIEVEDLSTNKTSINLHVNTLSLEEYTIRPSITIKTPFFDELTSIVRSRDFSLFNCGHFYIDQKLAHFYGCEKYYECAENKYNYKNPLFLFRVRNEESVDVIINRINEMFDDFLQFFLNSLNSQETLFETYKQMIHNYDKDVSNRPNISYLERPLLLDINAFLTFVFLGQKNNYKDFMKEINMFLFHIGSRDYWIKPTIKILESFGNVDHELELLKC